VEIQLAREVREMYWPSSSERDTTREADLARLKDIYGHSYFFSPMDTDSRLLAAEDIPVFSFILTQPTSFSLSTLFTIPLPKLPLLFAKTAFGSQPPTPLGKELLYLFLADFGSMLWLQVWGMEMTLVSCFQCHHQDSQRWSPPRLRERLGQTYLSCWSHSVSAERPH